MRTTNLEALQNGSWSIKAMRKPRVEPIDHKKE